MHILPMFPMHLRTRQSLGRFGEVTDKLHETNCVRAIGSYREIIMHVRQCKGSSASGDSMWVPGIDASQR